MKRFLWGIALLLTVVGQSAYADSIPNFNITQATMFVGVNNGTGDNIFFDLTIEGDLQQVRFAADLAVLNVLLRGAAAIIDG